MGRFVAGLIVVALIAATWGAESGAQTGAQVSVSVEPGTWQAMRLRNLAAGSELAVEIESDGPVAIALVDETGYTTYPAPEKRLFNGHTAARLGFAVAVPAAGTYYLVVDNREGDDPRLVAVSVEASGPAPDVTGETANAPPDSNIVQQLADVEAALKQVFQAEGLSIRAVRCGTANAFSHDGEVLLCAEFAQSLIDALGDAQKASDALLFALLHEAGHILLSEWGYPFHDNEEIADEFAVAIMVMFDQEHRVATLAEYFAAIAEDDDLAARLKADEPHPLSMQRAYNVLRWLDEPDFVARWQQTLVPHMRTAFLEHLLAQPAPWSSSDLIAAELARREADGSGD